MRHECRSYVVGFRNVENDEFVGELCEPIAVTCEPGAGLIRLGGG